MRRRLRSRTEHPITPKLEKVRNQSPRKSFGSRYAKRVRFEDAEMDGVAVHVSARRHEASQSPASDGPKTSEYAYFRKVKGGDVRGYKHSVHKENRQLKGSKLSYSLRDNVRSSEVLKSSTKEFTFSVEGKGLSDHHPFLSPGIEEPTKKSGKGPSLLFHNVTPLGQCPSSSLFHETPKISENQHTEKGIFAAKRQRLRQWAAQTLFVEVENPHPKGPDLVSSLLSRLFPKHNEDDDLLKGDTEKSRSLVLHGLNNLEKGLHLSYKGNWGKDHSKLCYGGPDEIVSLDWNKLPSGFPLLGYDGESYALDKSRECDHHLKRQIHRISDTLHDFSSLCLPFERYRSPGYFHFKGLNEFDSAIEHSKGPCRLFLECDFQMEKDHLDSLNTDHDIGNTLAPRLTASWNLNRQQILDNVVSTKRLFSPSLYSNHCQQFDSLSNYGSTDLLTPDYALNFDDVKRAMAEPGRYSLEFPHTPKYITLADDILCQSDFMFSNGDQHWLKNKVWKDIHQGDFWGTYLSAGEFYAENSPIPHSWRFPKVETVYTYGTKGSSWGTP